MWFFEGEPELVIVRVATATFVALGIALVVLVVAL